MTAANEIQVGGTHYRTPFQHWDLAAELRLGYFEGQVSKYVTRHRSKKGLEDAQKAGHFTQKMIELNSAGVLMPQHKFITAGRLAEYVEANRLTPQEHRVLNTLLCWGHAPDLRLLADQIAVLIKEVYSC